MSLHFHSLMSRLEIKGSTSSYFETWYWIRIYAPAVGHLECRVLWSYPLPVVHSFLISKQTNPPCVISFTQSCELLNKKQFKTMYIHPLTGSLLVLFSISPQIILITLPFFIKHFTSVAGYSFRGTLPINRKDPLNPLTSPTRVIYFWKSNPLLFAG